MEKIRSKDKGEIGNEKEKREARKKERNIKNRRREYRTEEIKQRSKKKEAEDVFVFSVCSRRANTALSTRSACTSLALK
jgi:hypothetical protein